MPYKSQKLFIFNWTGTVRGQSVTEITILLALMAVICVLALTELGRKPKCIIAIANGLFRGALDSANGGVHGGVGGDIRCSNAFSRFISGDTGMITMLHLLQCGNPGYDTPGPENSDHVAQCSDFYT